MGISVSAFDVSDSQYSKYVFLQLIHQISSFLGKHDHKQFHRLHRFRCSHENCFGERKGKAAKGGEGRQEKRSVWDEVALSHRFGEVKNHRTNGVVTEPNPLISITICKIRLSFVWLSCNHANKLLLSELSSFVAG